MTREQKLIEAWRDHIRQARKTLAALSPEPMKASPPYIEATNTVTGKTSRLYGAPGDPSLAPSPPKPEPRFARQADEDAYRKLRARLANRPPPTREEFQDDLAAMLDETSPPKPDADDLVRKLEDDVKYATAQGFTLWADDFRDARDRILALQAHIADLYIERDKARAELETANDDRAFAEAELVEAKDEAAFNRVSLVAVRERAIEELANYFDNHGNLYWGRGEIADAIRALKSPTGETCNHAGWDFAKHGRCCPSCGAFMSDPGD